MSEERKGELYLALSAVLWALFPVVTILSLSALGPVSTLAWTTLISSFFFVTVAIIRKSWVNIFKKEILLPLLYIALIIGVAFYGLMFYGLQHTSAGNVAIIATAEILFTYLFFNVWKKESIDVKHVIGALSIFISAVIILLPNFKSVQIGDIYILLAVMFVPIGNMYQKQVRSYVSSEQILLFRTLMAVPFLFLLAYVLGENISTPPSEVWWALCINGLVLFGVTKILWIESIIRVGMTKAISISSVSPLFTLFFAYLILGDIPTQSQLLAVPFAVGGVYLLTRKIKGIE